MGSEMCIRDSLYSGQTTTTINRCTRLKIVSDTLDESGGTGQCRGIGIQTFSIDAKSSYTGTNTISVTDASGAAVTSGKDNLIFKLDIRGQQGNIGGNGDSPDDFACAYSRQVILLHGGEGWVTGDRVEITMDSAKGRTVSGSSSSGTSGNSGKGESSATYVLEVTEHEPI